MRFLHVYKIIFHDLKTEDKGRKDDSGDESEDCSCRGPKFTHMDGSQPSVIPAPGH